MTTPEWPDPWIGKHVKIEFLNGHPPVEGRIQFLSDEFISVGEKRFKVSDIKSFHIGLR